MFYSRENERQRDARQSINNVFFSHSSSSPRRRWNGGLIPPAPARFRRKRGERSSTGHSALESQEQRHAEGHYVAGWQPRQDGLSTRWHLRDRRGCIPSCRCRLRGRRRSARTMHARRRDRRGSLRLADETTGNECQRGDSETPFTMWPGLFVAEPRPHAIFQFPVRCFGQAFATRSGMS